MASHQGGQEKQPAAPQNNDQKGWQEAVQHRTQSCRGLPPLRLCRLPWHSLLCLWKEKLWLLRSAHPGWDQDPCECELQAAQTRPASFGPIGGKERRCLDR